MAVPDVQEPNLDAIRARADAATPGPWYAPALASGVRHLERNCSDWYFEGLPNGCDLPGRQHGDGGTADGEFIAHAREDIPALLAALTQLQAERDAAVEALREIAEYEEPWPQDPSDVYEHFQAVARAALAAAPEAETT